MKDRISIEGRDCTFNASEKDTEKGLSKAGLMLFMPLDQGASPRLKWQKRRTG